MSGAASSLRNKNMKTSDEIEPEPEKHAEKVIQKPRRKKESPSGHKY